MNNIEKGKIGEKISRHYLIKNVNIRKQRKIINTSFIYIKNNKMDNFQLRYDIIEVYLTNNLSINHIENAFCL